MGLGSIGKAGILDLGGKATSSIGVVDRGMIGSLSPFGLSLVSLVSTPPSISTGPAQYIVDVSAGSLMASAGGNITVDVTRGVL
jgi:hypothetical protein